MGDAIERIIKSLDKQSDKLLGHLVELRRRGLHKTSTARHVMKEIAAIELTVTVLRDQQRRNKS